MIISNEKRIPVLFFILLLLLPAAKLFSQSSKSDIQGEFKAGDAIVSPILTAPCMGSRNEPSEDLNWQPLIIPKRFEHDNPSPNEELLNKIKAEKQKLKDQAEQLRTNQPENELSTATYDPIVDTSFMGNLNNGGTPLDNCIAVSDAGIVVSTANTTFRIYNSTGVLKYNKSVLATINDPSITDVCDEYVLYDRRSDRFIAFAEECSGDYSQSQLLILFSKSNNPASDGWWYYKLSGNPFFNDGQFSWFDYPKMAVSNNELYISGNLFSGKSFNEAAVWQIRKSDGYAGDSSLTYQVWHEFAGSPFTICPVGDGQGNSYGPGCYMIASSSSGGSYIQMYHLTNDIGGTPAPQIIYNEINIPSSNPPYSPAADASQLGTNVKLKINDCRMMNGFFLDGIIHFVFNSDYIGAGYLAGYSGIYYGRLLLSNNSITVAIFSTYYNDYAYPSVCSFASKPNDKSVLIGYGLSGSSIYPQIGVIQCDNMMNWSDPITVKASTGYVNDGSTTTTSRWGDYTGTSRLNSSDTPAVWISGSYASSNRWNSWIARINGINQPLPPVTSIYPDPITSSFQLEFNMPQTSPVEVDIYDMQGKLVKDLYKGAAYQGDNVLSFDKSRMSAGVYILTIYSNSNYILKQKIVISN